MKNIFILLFLTTCCLDIHAQNIELFTDLNFGLLSHQSLKKFHNDLADQFPFNNIKNNDDFNYNYGFTLGLKINKIRTSFFYSNRVSGAKSSYTDYSGYVRLTNDLQGSTFGIVYEIELQKFSNSNLSLGIKGLLTSSKLKLKSESYIEGSKDDSSFNFNSLDFGAGATIIYEYPLKFMTLRSLLGVDIYMGGKLKSKEFKGAHLLDENGNKVTTGWSGLNIGIGAAFPLGK